MNSRMKLAVDAMKQAKLEAMLVSNLTNIRYLTGFTGSNAMLALLPDRAVFWTDPRYSLQAAQETGSEPKLEKGPLLLAAAKWLSRRGLRRVGFERESLRFEQFEVLKERVRMQPVSHLVEGLRMIKSAAEIARIRAAVNLNSQAFEQALRAAKPGMRETSFAGLIDYRMRRLGADGTAFDTIVAAGVRGALPHAHPGRTRFAPGTLVLVDMGARLAGYTSDMTRMFHFGQPDNRVKQLYAAVLEAQLAAIDVIRAGAAAAKVDSAARNVLARHGLADQFVHSTGHGLGLEIHEDPRIGRKAKLALEAGMVVTVEPGIYLEGWGGIRIEDTVLVTPSGAEILTSTSKELRILDDTVL